MSAIVCSANPPETALVQAFDPPVDCQPTNCPAVSAILCSASDGVWSHHLVCCGGHKQNVSSPTQPARQCWLFHPIICSPPRFVSHQPRERQRYRFQQTAGHAVLATVDFCSRICLTTPTCQRHRFLQTAGHAVHATVDFCSRICLTSPCLASAPWKTMPKIPADSRSCSLCHCGFPQHHLSHLPVSRINLVEDNARFLQTAGHAVYVTVDFHSITCLTSPCLASTSWKTMPDSCRQQVMQSMLLWISTASPVSPPRVSHQPRGRQCHRFFSADSRSCSLCHCGFPQQH